MTQTATRPLSRTSDSPSESSSDEIEGLCEDDLFHILQTNRRREAIRFLLEQDGPVKMRDVAEHVAAREHETTVAELTSAQRQRVYIPLYQSHLPKLDREGLIEYEKSRGIVHPTERLRIFEPYLEDPNSSATGGADTEADTDASADTDSDRSSEHTSAGEYYVTAIGTSASLVVAAASGLLSISGLILAAVITTLFTLATIATTLPRRTSTNVGEPKSLN